MPLKYELCLLIFFQCFILHRNLVANNFVISSPNNRSVHIPKAPQVFKYNCFVLVAHFFLSKLPIFCISVSYLGAWSAFSEIHPVFLALQCVSFHLFISSRAYLRNTRQILLNNLTYLQPPPLLWTVGAVDQYLAQIIPCISLTTPNLDLHLIM